MSVTNCKAGALPTEPHPRRDLRFALRSGVNGSRRFNSTIPAATRPMVQVLTPHTHPPGLGDSADKRSLPSPLARPPPNFGCRTIDVLFVSSTGSAPPSGVG